jgi:hypothetical protein
MMVRIAPGFLDDELQSRQRLVAMLPHTATHWSDQLSCGDYIVRVLGKGVEQRSHEHVARHSAQGIKTQMLHGCATSSYQSG